MRDVLRAPTGALRGDEPRPRVQVSEA